MFNYFKYLNIGLMAVMPALVGLMMGAGIDGHFNTRPIYTLFGLFLGILSGFWSAYKTIRSML